MTLFSIIFVFMTREKQSHLHLQKNQEHESNCKKSSPAKEGAYKVSQAPFFLYRSFGIGKDQSNQFADNKKLKKSLKTFLYNNMRKIRFEHI
jgi:hypothetical protein